MANGGEYISDMMGQDPWRNQNGPGGRGTIYHGEGPAQIQPMPGAGGVQPSAETPPPTNISKYANRDPNAQWTRNDVLNTLKQYGAATRENVDRAIRDNPWLGTQVGTIGGKLKNPRTGEIWDVIGNNASGNGHWQTLTGHSAKARAASGPVNNSLATTAVPQVAQPTAAPLPAQQAAPQSGVPQFNQAWMGTAQDWGNPAVAWHRIMAVHGGNMTPEQKAFAMKQMQAGANAYNPFAPGAAPGAAPDGAPAPSGEPAQDPKGILMQQLMDRMQQDLSIDRTDPIIRNQSDAYAAQAERARRDYLGDVAESSSPYATGKIRNEQRMTAEKLAQGTAGFEAELMGRELTARRQEIQHALDSMGNLLTEQERQALQRELAKADNDLRRYGIDTQNSQFFAGLSQADKHFAKQLAQTDRLAGKDDRFRWAQLGQNDEQFRDQMGFNTADRQAYWDSVRRGIL